MGLRLNDGSGNHVELSAPTLTSNVNITLPNSVGTDGQFLKVGANGLTNWETVDQFSGLIGAQNPTVSGAFVGASSSVSETATALIQAGGTPPYSFSAYQWSWQASGQTGFEDISGATSANYTIPTTLSYGGSSTDTEGGQIRVAVTIQDSSNPAGTVTLTSAGVTIESFNFNLSWTEGTAFMRRYNSSGTTTNDQMLFGPSGSTGRVINFTWRAHGTNFSAQNFGVLADGTLYQGNSTGSTMNTTRNTDFDRAGRQIVWFDGMGSSVGATAIYDDGSAMCINSTNTYTFDSSSSNWQTGGIEFVNSGGQYDRAHSTGRLADGTWIALGANTWGGVARTPFETLSNFPSLPGSTTIVDWGGLLDSPANDSRPIAWLGSDGQIYATGSDSFSNNEWNGTNGWTSVADFTGQSTALGSGETFVRIYGYLTNNSGITLQAITNDGKWYWGTGNASAGAFRDKGFTNIKRLPYAYRYAYAPGTYMNFFGLCAGDNDIYWIDTVSANNVTDPTSSYVYGPFDNGGGNWGTFGCGQVADYAGSGVPGNLFIVPPT